MILRIVPSLFLPCLKGFSLQLMGKEKPVWRVAFFSRLEERKGIKLFVEAINQLDVSHIPNFEVAYPLISSIDHQNFQCQRLAA